MSNNHLSNLRFPKKRHKHFTIVKTTAKKNSTLDNTMITPKWQSTSNKQKQKVGYENHIARMNRNDNTAPN